jgi:hypothetical protein
LFHITFAVSPSATVGTWPAIPIKIPSNTM